MSRSLRRLLPCTVFALLTSCSEAPPVNETVATAAAPDLAGIAELQAQLASLEARKQRIEDSNAIKRLQRAFGFYMSEGQWQQVADLFAASATLEFGRDGVYRGQQRILAWLQAWGGTDNGLREGQLNEFFQLMPVVTLAEDGTTAKARWRGIMLLGQLGEQALWGEGPYENEYVKEAGVWKLARLRWFQTIVVPYEGGWARHADFNKGIWVSATLPADAPPTAPYGSWPETFLPPFSFTNPVGRYSPEPVQEVPASAGGQP